MSIRRKVRSVERIFNDLEKKIEAFKQETQLHCVAGCGFCCKNPGVEATIIEFLPLAFYYYLNGVAEEKHHQLKEYPQAVCHIFREGSEPDAGYCTMYTHRGLICRLFGFSARKNKYGAPELSTCRKIKETFPERYIDTTLSIKNGLKIPVISDYYQQLRRVDFDLSQQMYPINTAIMKAIEVVMSYYAYRKNNINPMRNHQKRGTMPSPGVSQGLISDPQ